MLFLEFLVWACMVPVTYCFVCSHLQVFAIFTSTKAHNLPFSITVAHTKKYTGSFSKNVTWCQKNLLEGPSGHIDYKFLGI